MELRPGYKQTEIGVIPEDWDVLPLGAFGKFKGGNGFPLRYQGHSFGDYPFFKVSDMNNDGNSLFMQNSNHWISEKTRKELGATTFPSGSITFAKIGAAIFLERKRILVRDSCIDNNVMAFVFNSAQADWRFFHFIFLTIELGKLVSATALPSLNGRDIAALTFGFPKAPEQGAIAAALSDVDALIAALDALVAKKRDLKQAAMQQLLTGKTRLPGFDGDWQRTTIGRIADVKTGPFGAQLHESDYARIGTPIITVEHLGEFGIEVDDSVPLVSEKDVARLQAYRLVEGDIVFSRVGSVDRNSLVRKAESGWLFSGRLLRIRPISRFNPAFLSYLFHSTPFKNDVISVAVGQTMASLNTKILKGISILLPTDHREQGAIAEVLSAMDADLSGLEAKRDKARVLKQGMMQELLTGRIRLK